MARLIDADELIAEFEWLKSQVSSTTALEIQEHIQRIKDAPTVDAVEVVRCKDCKKWFRHTEVDRERGECRRYQTTKHETGYCDRGERKDND